MPANKSGTGYAAPELKMVGARAKRGKTEKVGKARKTKKPRKATKVDYAF